MPSQAPSNSRRRKSASVRQSVTMPAKLAREVRRVAKERHLTISRALVTLAERGVEAEKTARQQLNTAYERFLGESSPERKNKAGTDLIRAVFGKSAMAKDTLL